MTVLEFYDFSSLLLQRDNLRLGVDDLLDKFKPVVKHNSYEVTISSYHNR